MSFHAQAAHESIDELQQQCEWLQDEVERRDAQIKELEHHVAVLETCVDRLDKTAETLMERV